jgi:hypothetical protein
MYTIINTPAEIVVFEGVYREFVLKNGSRGCEPLKQCNTILEVKQSIRDIIKHINKPIQTPFPLHLTKLEQYRLGMISQMFTDEQRHRMRLAKLGDKNPTFGGHKEETKRKMSLVKKGRPSNHTGKKHKLESRLKTSKSMKGKRNCVGWIWIHNHDCERRVKGDVPVGWKRGRLPGFMKDVQRERWRK